jgi:hypothetical protein
VAIENLKTHERIADKEHSTTHHGHHNSGLAHIVTIQGIEYFMKRADGPLMGDSYFDGIHNKSISITGEFVGGIIIVSSWSLI